MKLVTIIAIDMKRAVEQFNGREGETATLLSRCVVTFGGLGGGFAPRHLSRSAFSLKSTVANGRRK